MHKDSQCGSLFFVRLAMFIGSFESVFMLKFIKFSLVLKFLRFS